MSNTATAAQYGTNRNNPSSGSKLTNDRFKTYDGGIAEIERAARHNPYREFLYVPRRGPNLEWNTRITDIPRSFTDISNEDIDVKMQNVSHDQQQGELPVEAAMERVVPQILFSNPVLGGEEGDPSVVPVDVALQRMNSSNSHTRHSSRRGSVTSLARSSSTGSRGSSPRHRLVGDAENMVYLISKHKMSKEYFVAPDRLYQSQKICEASGGIQFSPGLSIAEFEFQILTQVIVLATSNLGLNQDTKHLALTIGSIFLSHADPGSRSQASQFEVAKVSLMIAIKMRERDTKLPTYKLISSVCASSLKYILTSEQSSPSYMGSPKNSNHSREKPSSMNILTGTTATNSDPHAHKSGSKPVYQESRIRSQEVIPQFTESRISLPSLEADISGKFAWNLSFLTVHDYLVRFFLIGVLLDTDKLVGYQRAPNLADGNNSSEESLPPAHGGHHHRIQSEHIAQSGNVSPRYAHSMDWHPEEPGTTFVKNLLRAELKTLLTQIESDALLLCDLLSERVLIPLRKAQVYAFYLLLLARAMSKVTEDK